LRNITILFLIISLFCFVHYAETVTASTTTSVHNFTTGVMHDAASISNDTVSTGLSATNVQTAIVELIGRITSAASLQSATQTVITTISGLSASNVQTALAEINGKIPTSSITLISSEVVIGDLTTTFSLPITSPTTYKKLNLVINGVLGKSGEPASTGEVKIWLNNTHSAGDYAVTTSFIETNGVLSFDSVYTTTEVICSMTAGSNLQPDNVIDLTITQPSDSNFCATIFGTNIFSSLSGGDYYKRNKTISAGARNAGTISSVQISSAINFREGTRVYLYGIK